MSLFQINTDSFSPIQRTSFVEMKLSERNDLQRLLKNQIEVIDEDLYVLTEEFGEWEDSRRRVDLLAIDKQANLVVIELKRTHDGGHMELQALRYAAMVSAMTLDKAISIHADYLSAKGENAEEAESRISQFLSPEDIDEESFAENVRILLVSEDFGIELTTTVLWLRDRDIDIRCVRLRPYSKGDEFFIDVQQIIPLPEVQEYQVQIRRKEQQGKKEKSERNEIRFRFWSSVVQIAKNRGTKHANSKPGGYHWLGVSSGTRGLSLNYVVTKDTSGVELYIDRGAQTENKAIFDHLKVHEKEIKASFGEPLSWERLNTKRASRIKHIIDSGGYRNPEAEWPELHKQMVDAMDKLWSALESHVEALPL